MGRKAKVTPAQVSKALQDAHGLQAAAARNLRVSRTTISNYIKDNPSVKAAYDDVNETTIDFVEGELLKNIRNGNIIAQIFYLKTKAKHRGYIERTELTGKEGAPLFDPSTMKPTEIKARAESLLKAKRAK